MLVLERPRQEHSEKASETCHKRRQHSQMMHLARLVLVGACVLHLIDAASIRSHVAKAGSGLSIESERQEEAVASLAALAAKYNCESNATSLVTVLMRVMIENKAANESLVESCRLAQDKITANLENGLAYADAVENQAVAKGLSVFNAAFNVARRVQVRTERRVLTGDVASRRGA